MPLCLGSKGAVPSNEEDAPLSLASGTPAGGLRTQVPRRAKLTVREPPSKPQNHHNEEKKLSSASMEIRSEAPHGTSTTHHHSQDGIFKKITTPEDIAVIQTNCLGFHPGARRRREGEDMSNPRLQGGKRRP